MMRRPANGSGEFLVCRWRSQPLAAEVHEGEPHDQRSGQRHGRRDHERHTQALDAPMARDEQTEASRRPWSRGRGKARESPPCAASGTRLAPSIPDRTDLTSTSASRAVSLGCC
jgi:hypothetical protein